MNAETSHHNVDVAAGIGKTETVNVSGVLFICKEATARFDVSFDNRPKVPCEGGFNFRFPNGFNRVTIFNLSATDALTVDIYAGNALVEYQYLRARQTRTKARNGGLLNGESADFPGIDSGNRRKSITISNRHATSELLLTDGVGGSGNVMVAIPAKTITPPIETDGFCSLFNNSGGTVTYAALQLFFTT